MTTLPHKDYKPLLGARIRALRTSQELSLRKFALMVGIDHAYLIDIELGRRNTTVDMLTKIAEGLGVELKDLFDFDA